MSTKVAIVEDDVAIAQMYRRKFELEGYKVAVAGDGETGLALIEQFKPDVLLLDLMMPNMDGKALLEELKHKPWAADLIVLILTNRGDTDAHEQAAKFGVADYIIKAELTPKEVVEKVRQLLSK